MDRIWPRAVEPGLQVQPAPNKPYDLGQSTHLGTSLGLHLLDCERRQWYRLPLESLLALTYFKILRIIDLALLRLLKMTERRGEWEGKEVFPPLHCPTPTVMSAVKHRSDMSL